MDKRIVSLFGGAVGGAVLLSGSLAMAAAPQAKATGDITMSGPSQAVSFSAFDSINSSMPAKGQVTYTNFEYPGGLSYTADVLCANVGGSDATIIYQIPAGFPGLSGLYVGVMVHDGGTPGTSGDTYGHAATPDLGTATTWCESGSVPITNYPITSGNLVVH